MCKSLKSVCIIIPWFGEEPFWLDYFFRSVSYNNSIDFLFVTDLELPQELPQNIIVLKSTLYELNASFSRKLKLETDITNPYKLCDFKPAYGYLFEEHIRVYDYWGYCDLDMIFGDIRLNIGHPLNQGFDIITADDSFIPGHFCLLRNNESMTTLFMQASNLKKVFQSNKSYYFDELILRKGKKLAGANRSKLLNSRIRKHNLGQFIKKYLKWLKPFYCILRLSITNKSLVDFNSIIRKNAIIKYLSVYQKKLYLSDLDLYNDKIYEWDILWDNGRLFYKENELLYFHFQLSKDQDGLKFIDQGNNCFRLEKR